MAAVISDRRHILGSPRDCDACGCPIEVGTVYVLQFIADGGDRWQWRAHEDCHQVAGEYADQHPHVCGPWDAEEFLGWLSELPAGHVWAPWRDGILERFRAENGEEAGP